MNIAVGATSAQSVLMQAAESSPGMATGCFHGCSACSLLTMSVFGCLGKSEPTPKNPCPKTNALFRGVLGLGFLGRFINWGNNVGMFSLAKTISFSLSVFSAISLIPSYTLEAIQNIKNFMDIRQEKDNKAAKARGTMSIASCVANICFASYGMLELASLVGGVAISAGVFKAVLIAGALSMVAGAVVSCFCVIKEARAEANEKEREMQQLKVSNG